MKSKKAKKVVTKAKTVAKKAVVAKKVTAAAPKKAAKKVVKVTAKKAVVSPKAVKTVKKVKVAKAAKPAKTVAKKVVRKAVKKASAPKKILVRAAAASKEPMVSKAVSEEMMEAKCNPARTCRTVTFLVGVAVGAFLMWVLVAFASTEYGKTSSFTRIFPFLKPTVQVQTTVKDVKDVKVNTTAPDPVGW